MIKKILLLVAGMLISFTLKSQQTFTINTAGFTFNPDALAIHTGDMVQFNAGAGHTVLQVSEATYNANGTTPLQGGFSFPDGTGSITPATAGTIYYVCTNHVSSGMKGTITVSVSTGIADHELNSGGILYPVPADDFLIYKSNGRYHSLEIKIMDLTGKAVILMNVENNNGEEIIINVSNLNRGFYIIRIKSEKVSFARKFLKS